MFVSPELHTYFALTLYRRETSVGSTLDLNFISLSVLEFKKYFFAREYPLLNNFLAIPSICVDDTLTF